MMRAFILFFALVAAAPVDVLWDIREVFIHQDRLPDAATRCLLYDKIIINIPWLSAEIDQNRAYSGHSSLKEECEVRSLQEELRKLNGTEPETMSPIPGPSRDIYIGEAYLYDWDGKVHVRAAGGKRFIFLSANWTVQDWSLPVSPIEPLIQIEVVHDINPEP